MERIRLRGHQITPTQVRLREGRVPEDVVYKEGYGTALNAQNVLKAIRQNPDILVEITDDDSSICSEDCKFKPLLWHHCGGYLIKIYEAEEAEKLGLKIGEIRPAKDIFDIPAPTQTTKEATF